MPVFNSLPSQSQTWLITGASGLLGTHLCRALASRGHKVVGFHLDHDITVDGILKHRVELLDFAAVNHRIAEIAPDVIAHTAGLTNVDECERNEALAHRLHVEASANIAAAAVRGKARLLHISTDHLWDGTQAMVAEDAAVSPINAYARTKAAAEKAVLMAHNGASVVRTNFFGAGLPWRESSSDWTRRILATGGEINAFEDVYFTPLAVGHLVDILIELAALPVRGPLHVAGSERISKYDFALAVAKAFGLAVNGIKRGSVKQANLLAPRPKDMSLSTKLAASILKRQLPNLQQSIARLISDETPSDMSKPDLQRPFSAPASALTKLNYGRQAIDEDDIKAVSDTLRGDYLTQGPMIDRFEAAICERTGARHAVAVSSGTAALHIAVMAAGVGTGDTIATQTLTFVGTANAGRYCGADVHLTDIDAETGNMHVDGLRLLLKKHPSIKAVLPVHFGGLSANASALREVAGKRIVIEDAAHSFGARYEDGQMIGCGAYADMTCFSFHPVKPFTTAEGGAVLTNSDELAHKLRLLRSHGIERDEDRFTDPDAGLENGQRRLWYYEHQLLGYNYRLTDLQAALGHSQLTKLDRFSERRKQIAYIYDKALAGLPHLQLFQDNRDFRERSAHHLYIANIDYARLNTTRQALMLALRERGIGTQVHYIPVHRQPYYRALYPHLTPADFPGAEAYYSGALSLPIFPLMEDRHVSFVVDALKDILGS